MTTKGPRMPLLNLAGSARKGGPAALPTPFTIAPRYACSTESWRVYRTDRQKEV